jgi:hypothetical protein
MKVSLACLWRWPQQQSLVLQGFPVRLVRGLCSPMQTTTSAREYPTTTLAPLDHIFMHLGEPEDHEPCTNLPSLQLKPNVRKTSYVIRLRSSRAMTKREGA